MTEEYTCGIAIRFTDGDDPEITVLHKGTEEECERVLTMVPAVAYSGDRPGAEAYTFCIPTLEFLGIDPPVPDDQGEDLVKIH